MARGINKVLLVGNLGADPDTRFTAQGSAVTNLSLATDESYKDKQTGQVVPRTEWHKIVLFNRLAEVAKQYTKKGSKIYIEGRLQTRKWQDQSGQDRYSTEIIVAALLLLDRTGEPSQAHIEPGHASQIQSPAVQPSPMADNPRGAVHQQPPGVDDFDDDIPF